MPSTQQMRWAYSPLEVVARPRCRPSRSLQPDIAPADRHGQKAWISPFFSGDRQQVAGKTAAIRPPRSGSTPAWCSMIEKKLLVGRGEIGDADRLALEVGELVDAAASSAANRRMQPPWMPAVILTSKPPSSGFSQRSAMPTPASALAGGDGFQQLVGRAAEVDQLDVEIVPREVALLLGDGDADRANGGGVPGELDRTLLRQHDRRAERGAADGGIDQFGWQSADEGALRQHAAEGGCRRRRRRAGKCVGWESETSRGTPGTRGRMREGAITRRQRLAATATGMNAGEAVARHGATIVQFGAARK